ncbi:sensor histidine kinase [Saccharopolyspora shandongensis]|uniref:sensor histidine kinase n=1 Tax=Saccharopolyspora shandongensis TaxID=418495 RepID=UPI00343D1719
MLTSYLENAFTHGRPPVEVRVTERAGWVEVRVCDRGPGVPSTFVPRLFERFSREARARKAPGSACGSSASSPGRSAVTPGTSPTPASACACQEERGRAPHDGPRTD